jgi:hypothetical protein
MDPDSVSKGRDGKPVFWGLLGIGFIAMLGGIVMFVWVVPKDMDTDHSVPRDAALLFTNVFLDELAYHNETGRYAAALSQVNVEPAACALFSCRLTVPPDGKSFTFRLSKDGRTWALTEKSPMPKEELTEKK